MMNQRKSWTQQEDQYLDYLYNIHSTKLKTHLSNWNSLSKLLNGQNIGPIRTGKQCRQRWCNQLNPQIKKDEEWSAKEQQILFNYHEKYGNRWSLISKQLPGRTDNSIKNYVNSTLRKSLRLINLYIACNRKYKQFKFRNVKEYKPQLLSKILALSSSSFIDSNFLSQCYKFTTKNSDKQIEKEKNVQNLAKQIKRKLLKIAAIEKSESQNSTTSNYYIAKLQYEDIIIKIHQLNSKCKKRKIKKGDSLNYSLEDQISENNLNQSENQKLKPQILQKQQNISFMQKPILTVQNSNKIKNKKGKFHFAKLAGPLDSIKNFNLKQTSINYHSSQSNQHYKRTSLQQNNFSNLIKKNNLFQQEDEKKKIKNSRSSYYIKKEEKIQIQHQFQQKEDIYQNYYQNPVHQEQVDHHFNQFQDQSQKNKYMLQNDKEFFCFLSQSQSNNSSLIASEEDWLQIKYI